MAEFAIASISTLALQNAPIEIPGQTPYLGAHLDFDWGTAFGLLIPIAVVHLILLGLIISAERFRRSGGQRVTIKLHGDESSSREPLVP